MDPVVPPNLLPRVRRFLAFQAVNERLGASPAKYPHAGICDPVVARSRVCAYCAPYGEASAEVEAIWTMFADLLTEIDRVVVPLMRHSGAIAVVNLKALLAERRLDPAGKLFLLFEQYASIQCVKQMKAESGQDDTWTEKDEDDY